MTTRLGPLLLVATCLLGLPAGAHARTPCPAETATPTAANAGQVSDAVSCLTNQIRAAYGLPALRRDARLDVAAALHSRDMGIRDFFDHVNPDGLGPGERAAAQGYREGTGENIAYGYPTARSVVLGWMQSAGHCRNILSSARDLGVGTAALGSPYYTQAFGDYFTQPTGSSAPRGCPYSVDLDALAVPAPATAIPVPAPAAVPPSGAPAFTAKAKAKAKAKERAKSKPKAKAKAKRKRAAASKLRRLSLSHRRVRTHGPRKRRGTTISYRLTAGATLTFRIQRAGGRRGRYRTVSRAITRRGKAGINRLRLSGRIGGRTLRPGRYRVRATVRGARGAARRPVVARFTVVRR